MEKLEFRPVTEAEHALATEFKRLTAVDATGSDAAFYGWFPPEKPYADLIKRTQEQDLGSCVLVWKAGEAIGHVHVFVRKDGEGKLNNIYLKPQWRGKGLGAQLNAYAIEYLRRHGAKIVRLKTNPQQPKLVDFYQRMGWRLGELDEHGMVWMEREIEA
jgi:GNAT superfamily N-acetyltransferase